MLALSVLPLLLLARGCVKDSDEVSDPEQDPFEVHYTKDDVVTKEMAIENWEMFLKQSQELIDITETNIASLEVKIQEADEPEKATLQLTSNAANLALLKLKAARAKRNKSFSSELAHYDAGDLSVQQQNEAFKTQFRRDMYDLNMELESALERSRSGLYK